MQLARTDGVAWPLGVKREGNQMSTPQPARKRAGIGLGGALVIVGAVIFFAWSWLGIFLVLIGLIAFGGFVRGKWY